MALDPMKKIVGLFGKAIGVAAIIAVIAFAIYAVFITVRIHYLGDREIVSTKISSKAAENDLKAFDLYEQGNHYLEQDNLKAAEISFRNGMILAGSTGTTSLNQYGLAQTLEKQGRVRDAYIAYRNVYLGGRSNTILDNDPLALARYAVACNQIGQLNEAISLCQRALHLFPLEAGDPALHLCFNTNKSRQVQIQVLLNTIIGIILSDRGANNDALTILSKTIRERPDQAVTQFYYAKALVKAGRKADAQAAFHKAAEIGQGDVKAAAEKALSGR